jgi:large subunit ribosomal protein L21
VVRHPISLLHPYLSAEEKEEISATANEKFAVIQLSGTQYKVAIDDVVVSNLIHGYDIGECMEIKDVLLVGTQNDTVVGRPLVSGATVVLEVEEHTKDEKVVIFKRKRRKNYKRTTGFRRDVTIMRVVDIRHDIE